MLLVVGHLNSTATPRFGDSLVHGVRRFVGIHDDLAIRVSSRTADRLDERAVVAQEAFLVGVEDGHERHLRQVEALAQEVDAHKRVELAAPERAEDLDTLERCDVGMHVTRFQAAIEEVVGQIFRHLLGERGDKRTLVALGPFLCLVDDVVDLACT